MPVALIALGSNVGDRQATLSRAVELLGQCPGIDAIAASRWLATAPVGGPAGQDAFLNGAARIETALGPLDLLAVLRNIETRLGRQRHERWAARTLDLDLLLYDGLILATPELTVPHPRMTFRRFVLQPAAEVAAQMVHPQLGWSVAALLANLDRGAAYLAIIGAPGCGNVELAHETAAGDSRYLIAESPNETGALAADLAECLQRLRRRAATISIAALAAGPGVGAQQSWQISDFWLGQSVAEARTVLSHADAEKVAEEFARQAKHVISPRLLVVLEIAADRATPRQAAIQNELRRWIEQLPPGPYLVLPAEPREAALEEIVAALAAME